MVIRRGLATAAILLAGLGAQAQWSNPTSVSGQVTSTGGRPKIAVSASGEWIVTWENAPAAAVFYSRSTNRGNTWGTTAELQPSAGWLSQGAPSIASNVTSGTFLAAWQSDNSDGIPEAAIARTAKGQTGFPPVAVVGQTITYFGMSQPVIAHGGNNLWALGGVSTNVSGNDEAIEIFRSTNEGNNWNFSGSLGRESSSPLFDRNFDMAGDAEGNLIAITESRQGSPDTPSSTFVRFSRSVDQGATWSGLTNLDGSNTEGAQPKVASGGNGHFVAALVRGVGSGNIKAYVTSDNGGDWNPSLAPVNTLGLDASASISGLDVAMDPEGNSVVVWSAQDPLGSRKRLFYSTSRDFGNTWSAADYVTTPTIDAADELPAVEYDGNGRWAATWQRRAFGTSTTLSIMSASLVFPIRADLSVSQKVTPEPATVGDPVKFGITVRNDGPSSATGVRLTSTLPVGGEVVSITQSQGTRTETSGSVTFELGQLLQDGVATAEITMNFADSGFYKNTAEVTADQEDVDLQDRVSTATARVLVEGVDLTGEWTKMLPDVPRKPYKGRLKLDTKLTVQNLGNQRARSFKVLLMLSNDEILSEDDAFVAVKGVDHLGPGNERIIDWEPMLRRYIPWQGKHLLAVIDAEMRVDEADEFNNSIESDELPAPPIE